MGRSRYGRQSEKKGSMDQVALICLLSALATARAERERAGVVIGYAEGLGAGNVVLERWCWSSQGAC